MCIRDRVGFVAGAITSKIVRQQVERRRRVAELAPAAASLTFSLVLVVGLLVALGFVQPDSLSKLRDDTINYLPRVLSALIVVILGGVAGTIASTAARQSLGRTMGRLGDQVPTVLKGIITAFAAILAAAQLGIDTTVINIVVGAAAFGLALAFAMVVGFGSRPVATELASGRALRRMVAIGDSVENDDLSGVVVAMHPTAVEIDAEGKSVLMQNSDFARAGFAVNRPLDED